MKKVMVGVIVVLLSCVNLVSAYDIVFWGAPVLEPQYPDLYMYPDTDVKVTISGRVEITSQSEVDHSFLLDIYIIDEDFMDIDDRLGKREVWIRGAYVGQQVNFSFSSCLWFKDGKLCGTYGCDDAEVDADWEIAWENNVWPYGNSPVTELTPCIFATEAQLNSRLRDCDATYYKCHYEVPVSSTTSRVIMTMIIIVSGVLIMYRRHISARSMTS